MPIREWLTSKKRKEFMAKRDAIDSLGCTIRSGYEAYYLADDQDAPAIRAAIDVAFRSLDRGSLFEFWPRGLVWVDQVFLDAGEIKQIDSKLKAVLWERSSRRKQPFIESGFYRGLSEWSNRTGFTREQGMNR